MEAVRREAKLEQSDDDGVAICPPLSIYPLSRPSSSSHRRSRLLGCLACCTSSSAMRTETLRGLLVLWGEAAAQYACLLRLRCEEGEEEGRQSFVIRAALGSRAPAAIGSRRATRNRSDFPLPHCARRFFGGFGLVGGATPEPNDRGFVVYLPGPGAGSVGPLFPSSVAACGRGPPGVPPTIPHRNGTKRTGTASGSSRGHRLLFSRFLPLWSATGIGCAIHVCTYVSSEKDLLLTNIRGEI